MKGRPPTPTKLRVLRGNPGKRPIERDAIEPPAEIPPCPEHLNADAKAEWERVTVELHKLGVIAQIDMAALAAYCQCYSRWCEAEIELITYGWIIKSPNGYPMHSPYLAIANRPMELLKAFAIEFGMTPVARSRVKSSAQLSLPLDDPFEDYLRGGQAS